MRQMCDSDVDRIASGGLTHVATLGLTIPPQLLATTDEVIEMGRYFAPMHFANRSTACLLLGVTRT